MAQSEKPYAENPQIHETISGLAVITEADASGRGPLPKGQSPAMQEILKKAEVLGCLHRPIKGFIQGQELIDANIPDGKARKIVMDCAYTAQLKGEFTDKDSAKAWLQKKKMAILLNSQTGPKKILEAQEIIESGIQPGPILSRITNALYHLQLEGKITTKEEAWQAAKKIRTESEKSLDKKAAAPTFTP